MNKTNKRTPVLQFINIIRTRSAFAELLMNSDEKLYNKAMRNDGMALLVAIMLEDKDDVFVDKVLKYYNDSLKTLLNQ
jgi:hypothetical protein